MKTWAGIWTVIPLAAKTTESSFLQSEFSKCFLNKRKEYKLSLGCQRDTVFLGNRNLVAIACLFLLSKFPYINH